MHIGFNHFVYGIPPGVETEGVGQLHKRIQLKLDSRSSFMHIYYRINNKYILDRYDNRIYEIVNNNIDTRYSGKLIKGSQVRLMKRITHSFCEAEST